MTNEIPSGDTGLRPNAALDILRRRMADSDDRELSEVELGLVCGGIAAPRDAASGLATGKRG